MNCELRHIPSVLLLLLLLASCSTTKDMPEEELLYRGIHNIDYNKWQSQHQTDSTGVIKALANTYNTVESLLSGNAPAESFLPTELTKEQRDSLKLMDKQDLEHYNHMRSELEGVFACTPNGSLMGSSYHTHPLLIGLWAYNRYAESTSRFGRWMYKTFATDPVYVSTVGPKVRTTVARTALRNNGYFRSQVAYDTITMKNPRKAKIAYFVRTGPAYHLDSIAYLHFPTAADSVIRATAAQSLLQKGAPFSASNLASERERIASNLKNKGYFYYQPEYIQYRADTLQRPLHVQLQVQSDPATPADALHPYHIGHTLVRVMRYGETEATDTVAGRKGFTYAFRGKKSPMRPDVLQRMLFYRPGSLYHENMHALWQQKMRESGQFSQVKTQYIKRDSTDNCDTLDMVVTAVLDRAYDAKLEGKVTGKSNGQVGPGVSFSFTKINAFRGAENLGFDVYGAYEWQTGANINEPRSLLNSYQFGTSLHLTYPRLMFFGWGDKIGKRAITSTQFALDARCQNRAGYFGRVTFGARVTYSYQHRRNSKHEFTPIRLDYEILYHSTERFDSIVTHNPSLKTSMRNQFVPSMEYTYNWRSTRGAQRTFSVGVKEAGNVTSGIYALAGRSFNEQNKQLIGAPFAQYVKAWGQYTHAFKLTPRSCIVTRAFLGAIYSYGNATSAPYNDLFTIGGANSIRAFAMRSIGPGSYHPANDRYAYISQTGDLKFEVNAEYRFPIVGDLYGATFVDAGNVWTLRQNPSLPGGQFDPSKLGKELALGTGIGLRYDLDFIVVRFDLGIGIHAPYETGKSTYYNMPSFAKSLGYHLAIGYPF